MLWIGKLAGSLLAFIGLLVAAIGAFAFVAQVVSTQVEPEKIETTLRGTELAGSAGSFQRQDEAREWSGLGMFMAHAFTLGFTASGLAMVSLGAIAWSSCECVSRVRDITDTLDAQTKMMRA